MYLHRKSRLVRHRKGRKTAIIFAACALLIAFVAVINPRLKSITRVYAESLVERMCYDAINSAADNAIEQSGVTYNDIVKIERNADNTVTAVMADIACVNKVKTYTNDELLSVLSQIDGETVRIPIGTITGNSLLIGRGPDIRVKTQLTGSSDVEIRSVFESVGINQTRHIIVMDIACKVNMVMLGARSSQEISLSVPIAETIIVGTVPDAFLNFS